MVGLAGFFAAVLAAQQQSPGGLVRGDLIEWDASLPAGELSIRAPNNQVFRFAFDPKTYFEREQQRITAARLRKGDRLEVVSDHEPEVAIRYARTVHVLERTVTLRTPASLGRYRAYTNPIEHLAPRGDMTFSGIVSRVNDERIVLRTRAQGEKTILLRQDTRYLADGSLVEAGLLKPTTRVFVRAGRNFDNEIEAFQVVWGEILEPGGPR